MRLVVGIWMVVGVVIVGFSGVVVVLVVVV